MSQPQPLKLVSYPFPVYYRWRSDSPRRLWHTMTLLANETYIMQSHGMFLRADKRRGYKYIAKKAVH